jgi:hypothetical protein
MSFEGKRQKKHTVDWLWLSPQPASTCRGDLRKGHILRKSRKGWAPGYFLPVAEAQAPDMTTIKKLPQLWLPILRFFPASAVSTQSNRIPCFRSSRCSPHASVTRSPSSSCRSLFMQVFGSKTSKEIERETEKIMVARTFVTLSRLLLVGAVLSGGIVLVGAQTATNPQAPVQTTAQAPAQSPGANSGAFPKKMKRTTNEERRAAAARHADRRAAQLRKHHGQVK